MVKVGERRWDKVEKPSKDGSNSKWTDSKWKDGERSKIVTFEGNSLFLMPYIFRNLTS